MSNKNKLFIISLSIFSFITGLLHIVSGVQHFESGIFHAYFLIFSGIIQLSWPVILFTNPNNKNLVFGLLINGGLLSLWTITRIFRAPFSSGPEHVTILGLSVFLLEISIALSTAKKLSTNPIAKKFEFGKFSLFCILFLILGSSFYSSTIIFESPILSITGESISHSHEESHEESSTDKTPYKSINYVNIPTIIKDTHIDEINDGHGH